MPSRRQEREDRELRRSVRYRAEQEPPAAPPMPPDDAQRRVALFAEQGADYRRQARELRASAATLTGAQRTWMLETAARYDELGELTDAQ